MHTVNNVIIHRLDKAKHGKVSVVLRDKDLPITEPVKKLVLDIHELYANRAGKGYGRFESDEINYPSASILRKCFSEKSLDFADASKQLLSVLAAKAGDAPLATGGYVLMAHITNAANFEWFIVAMINNVSGSAIDEKTLEVIDTVHIDFENLRVAGRVSLTDWLGEDKEIRYVGFLKQRGEVADYFKKFLGCNELLVNTEETKKLVQTLKSFAKSEGLDQQKSDTLLQNAYSYCIEKNKEDTPLSLEALANAAWPDDPKKLQKAFTENNVQISDGFVPDKRSLKALVRMKYKTSFWSLDLDRHALSQGYADYNQKTGELTLKKLPTDFQEELNRELDDGE